MRTGDLLKAQRMRSICYQWGEKLDRNWEAIRRTVVTPDKPEGLEAFLEEVGL